MPTRPRSLVLVLAATLAFAPPFSLAQSGDKATDKDKLSDAERAKRDADKVFSFIKFHTVKPAAPAAPKPTPAPRKAATPVPAEPAAGRVPEAAAASAPTVAAASVAGPAPASAARTEVPPPAPASASSQGVGASPPGLVPSAPSAPAPALAKSVAEPALEAKDEPEEVPLRLLEYVQPEMNAQVMAAMTSPQVIVPVRFTVQPDGKVSTARALGSVPRRLATAAVRAVQQWRFGPIPALREVDVEIAFNAGE